MSDSYARIDAAKNAAKTNQFARELQALPPGYLSGFRVTVENGRIKISSGICNYRGGRIDIPYTTYVMGGDGYSETLKTNTLYYLYLTSDRKFIVYPQVPVWDSFYRSWYHPDTNYLYISTIITGSAGGINITQHFYEFIYNLGIGCDPEGWTTLKAKQSTKNYGVGWFEIDSNTVTDMTAAGVTVKNNDATDGNGFAIMNRNASISATSNLVFRNVDQSSNTGAIEVWINNAAGLGLKLKINSDGTVDGGFMHNSIINGNMAIAQRGTAAVTATAGYPVDQMQIVFTKGGAAAMPTVSIVQAASTVIGLPKLVALTLGAADAAAPHHDATLYLRHAIEGQSWAKYGYGAAGAKDCTISFWVVASVAGTYGVGFRNSAADRSYVGSYVISAAEAAAAVPVLKSITVPGDTSGTWLTDTGIGMQISFDLGCGTDFSAAAGAWAAGNMLGLTGGTKLVANASATWKITGVMLNPGSVAAPFRLCGGTSDQEKILCWKRCFVWDSTSGHILFAMRRTAAYINAYLKFPVPMVAAPTMTKGGTWPNHLDAFGGAGEVSMYNQIAAAIVTVTAGQLTQTTPAIYVDGAIVLLGASDGSFNGTDRDLLSCDIGTGMSMIFANEL